MDQTRLIRTAALAITFVAFVGFATVQETPQDEAPGTTSLKDLAAEYYDFRGCDGGWNHVNDFWTADVSGLYTMTSAALEPSAAPAADARANDRDWCHVNDYWTTEVRGLYTLGSAADSSIKLIELSVASADADEESPD